ncbi:MAG TPA: DUF4142 domain-containing protein [Gemmatimonadales bacterium]|jgi:putative membrane protein
MLTRTLMILIGTVLLPAKRPTPVSVLPPSDATILGALAATDANEIETAKLASSKASAQEVKDYADQLVRDHERSRQEATALATRLGITPVVDTINASAHRDLMTKLNALSGVAFDRTFVLAMVAGHKAAIAQVSGTYLPAASNPQLRAFIQKLIPILRNHEMMGQRWLTAHKIPAGKP